MEIVLENNGFFLHVKNKLFEAGNGNQKQSFHPEKIEAIKVGKGGQITTDAIFLALEHTIEIIFIDYFGNPKGRIWNNKFGSIATIRKKQVFFAQSSQAMFLISEFVIRKIQNQHSFLGQIIYSQIENPDKKILEKLNRMKVIERQIKQMIIDDIPPNPASLRGWEGTVARIYFETLSILLPKKYQFENRSGRHANDMFNATLNYLYGILYALVEGALIQAGIDPAVGIWHADEYNKPVLTYDFIEPYRVWADVVLVRLCLADALSEDSFIKNQKSIWLSGKGKQVVVRSMQQYLDEIVLQNKIYRSRKQHLKMEANSLAQKIMKFE
ncbi:MAG: CRISPR-associated endonuclease Cas1 [Bacteroidetes bacterium]|nr:MAG: CRISPR-associated endonuclease Cas1 [Bacteroidota bacterium]TAG95892.1 MAG: CRISPR-associated endonuclease Cas1 [Bacteroidota bacterium]